MKPTAAEIQKEYTRGVRYKESLGRHGMFRQNEINERFYSGDQWYGAGCGEERPLVRQNIIRRIADYKMATVGADPITVTFSAQGIPDTPEMREACPKLTGRMATSFCRASVRSPGTAA